MTIPTAPPRSKGARRTLRERMLAGTLTRSLGHIMRDQPELADHAHGAPEAKVVGLEPLRVLVIGSGLAVGYGAKTHDEALTGQLARAIAALTGRGVVVQNRAGSEMRIDAVLADLGIVGAYSFGVVVWCPSLFEGVLSPNRGRFGQSVTTAIRLLRDTAVAGAPIILTTLPIPSRTGTDEAVARRVVPRFNRDLVRVAAAHRGVAIVEAPEIVSLQDSNPLGPAYYLVLAERIAAVSVAMERDAAAT